MCPLLHELYVLNFCVCVHILDGSALKKAFPLVASSKNIWKASAIQGCLIKKSVYGCG